MASSAQWASLVAQSIKNLPAIQETQVRFLGWEDPLENEMVTHSSILAWRIPQTEEPGITIPVHGITSVGHNLATKPPPLNGTEFEQTLGDSEKQGSQHAGVYGVTE